MNADPTDVVGRRAYAALIDALAWLLVFLGPNGILAAVVLSILNLVVLQGITGASVGKFVMRIRVVDSAGGARPGIYAALGRLLILPLDVLAGPFAVSRSQGHRRLGDMASQTCVVDAAATGVPPLVVDVARFAGFYDMRSHDTSPSNELARYALKRRGFR
jgi:uncharacterized RDD family membrane protein YckC